MLVKDLIKKLREFDENKRVILSSDEEGNNFHNVGEITDEKAGVLIYPEHDTLEDVF